MGKDIAVIGMDCKFPFSDTKDEYWLNLINGFDSMRDYPEERLSDVLSVIEKHRTKNEVELVKGGYLENISHFDYSFFKLTPKDAELLNPNQRMFLQTAWRALEDAGYARENLNKEKIGVFVGASKAMYDYDQVISANRGGDFSEYEVGNILSMVSGRVSYSLNLSGPSMTIDTACSSSLVAIHNAYSALKSNECSMVIAGGVRLDLFPLKTNLGIESSTREAKVFDDEADGTSFGEGVGAVILKPLEEAIKDKDHIYCVIKGGAVNQDGKTMGITAPNSLSQTELLKGAWDTAEISYDELSFIEAHGTGTKLGDPIELVGIERAFRSKVKKEKFCALGSVKANIGHLFEAAGIAGFIKCALMLQNRKIPQQIHFNTMNAQYKNSATSPMYIPRQTKDWENEFPKKCGISSFGFSGTNVHLVLEEYKNPLYQEKKQINFLPISAKNKQSLIQILKEYKRMFSEHTQLPIENICFMAAVNRQHHPLRVIIQFETINDLELRINELISGIDREVVNDVFENKGLFTNLKLNQGEKTTNHDSSISDLFREMNNEENEKFKSAEQICQQYVNGQKINWEEYYSKEIYSKVSIPCYHFEKIKCWVKPAFNARKNEQKKGEKQMATERIIDSLISIVTNVTGFNENKIETTKEFVAMGLDSIGLTQVKNAIKNVLKIEIPINELYGSLSTIEKLATYLESNFDFAIDEPQIPESETATAINIPSTIEVADTSTGIKSERIVLEQLELMKLQLETLKHSQNRGLVEPEVKQPTISAVVEEVSEVNESKAIIPKSVYKPYKKLNIEEEQFLSEEQAVFISNFIERLSRKTNLSKELTQKYRQVNANSRNVAGFRKIIKEIVYQIMVKKAEAARIWDIDDNEYVDITMGFGVNLFGHKLPFVNEQIKAEMSRGFAVGPVSPRVGEISKRICQMTGVERVAFYNTGTEAVMVALRIAKAVWKKKKIVIFAGSYHGTFDGILGTAGIAMGESVPLAPGISENLIRDLYVLPYDNEESLKFIEQHSDEIAAVLVEPVQSRRPDIQPKEFLHKLRKLTLEKGMALIFDEVITGFRISNGGAQEYFDIKADIVTYGKIIGGGLPIGIVAGKAAYLDSLDGGYWQYGDHSIPEKEDIRTFSAGTFCQHPFAIAAATAVLDKLESEDIQEELNQKTRLLAEELNAYFKAQEIPIEIVCFASLFRFVLYGDFDIFYYLLLEKGLYVWEGRNCFLSTAHTKTDIDFIIATIKEVVREMDHANFFKKKTFVLTNEQKEIYGSISLHKNSNKSLHETVEISVRGILELDILQQSLNKLVERHENLRATVVHEKVKIHDRGTIKINHWNLKEECFEEKKDQLVESEIDSSEEFGLRVNVLSKGKENHRLLFSCHHLFIDGWSIKIILSELVTEYNALLKGKTNNLAEPDSWLRFTEIQEIEKKSLKHEEAVTFWENKLSNNYVYGELPLEEFEYASLVDKEEEVSFQLSETLVSTIVEYGKKNNATLFSVLLASFYMVMLRNSGSRPLAIGVPFAGQVSLNMENLVGQCDSLLPLIIESNSNSTLVQMMQELQKEMVALSEIQKWSLTSLASDLPVADIPTINTVFNLDNTSGIAFEETKTTICKTPLKYTRQPLFVNILFDNNTMEVQFKYHSKRLNRSFIENLANVYRKILMNLDAMTEVPVLNYPIFSSKSNKDFVIDQSPKIMNELVKMDLFSSKEASSKKGKYYFSIIDSNGSPAAIGQSGEIVSFLKEELDDRGTEHYQFLNQRARLKPDLTQIEILYEKKESQKSERNLADNEMFESVRQIWSDILGVEQIELDADFIKLGGNSLKLISMGVQLQKVFGIQLPLAELFQNRTIYKLCQRIEAASSKSYLENAPKREYYPLTNTQKNYYVASQLNDSQSSYVVTGAVEIKKQLDVEELETALNLIIERNEPLRTAFIHQEQEIVQKILPARAMKLKIHKLKQLSEIDQILEEDEPFNLENGYLFKPLLFKLSATHYILFCKMHHIIADGSTAILFLDECLSILGGRQLSPRKWQFKDYAYQKVMNKIPSNHRRYWEQEIIEQPPRLTLSYQKERKQQNNLACQTFRFSSTSLVYEKVKTFTQERGITSFSLLLSVYFILLARHSNFEGDVVVGIPVDGRNTVETEQMMGCFVNTVCIKSEMWEQKKISDFLEEVNQKVINGLEHQDYPFQEIVNRVGGIRNVNRNPIIDFLFTMQNDDCQVLDKYGDEYTISEISQVNTEFDLVMNFFEFENNLEFAIDYQRSLYNIQDVEMFSSHYLKVLEMVVNSQSQFIYELELLTLAEKKLLIDEWGQNTHSNYNSSLTVKELFEKQAKKIPEYTALESENQRLTYRELDDLTNQAATSIRQKSIEKNVVGLICEQPFSMVIATLSAFKSSKTYTTFTPQLPLDRILLIINDCEITTFLVEDRSQAVQELIKEIRLYDQSFSFIYLSDINNMEKVAPVQPAINIEPEACAYIVYTSGTTGQPKGVMISHNSVANQLAWRMDEYNMSENDHELLLFNFLFDGFLTGALTALVSGATLHTLTMEATREPLEIVKVIKEKRISHFICVPTLYYAILSGFNSNDLTSLRRITLAGEPLTKELVLKSKKTIPNVEIINEYGPSENTVAATIKRDVTAKEKITIGRPSAQSQAYILDKYKRLQPIGVSGELYLGGQHLALGYLNLEEETKNKFIDNPYIAGNRLYATGDIVRFLPNKEIEYIGREDHQVKKNGYRIELSEIEKVALSYEGMEYVHLCLDRDYQSNDIYCFYISTVQIMPKKLKKHLATLLPNYMIPQFFQQVIAFNYAPNGKIDSRLMIEKYAKSKNKMNISTEIVGENVEDKVKKIWMTVLKNSRIDETDNFFDLGGDSIKAIQVSTMCTQQGMNVPMNIVMQTQTIRELCNYVQANSYQTESPIEVMESSELTPIQKWFFDVHPKSKQHFNQAVLVKNEQSYDLPILVESFNQLIRRHGQLRTVFIEEDAVRIRQLAISEDELNFKIDSKTLSNKEEMNEQINQLHRTLDIYEGKVIVAEAYTIKHCHYLAIVCHHLCIDSVSWKIMLEELNEIYSSLINHKSPKLAEPTLPFSNWSVYLKEYATKSRYLLEDGLNFYKETEEKCDFFEGIESNRCYLKKNYYFIQKKINSKITEALIQLSSSKSNVRIRESLITAFIKAFQKEESGKISLLLEGHGRESLDKNYDVSKTIGWFTTQYPIHFDLNSADLTQMYRIVLNRMHSIPISGLGYGLTRRFCPELVNELAAAPKILFNYLGEMTFSNDSSAFQIVDHDIGNSEDGSRMCAQPIEINTWIENNQVDVRMEYEKHLVNAETAEQLLVNFEKNLEKLIQLFEQIENEQLTTPAMSGNNTLAIVDYDYIVDKYQGNVDKIFELTALQKGMIFEHMMNPQASSYIEQICMDIEGVVNQKLFERAVNHVIRNNESLRSVIELDFSDIPQQVALKNYQLKVRYKDLSNDSLETINLAIDNFLKEDQQTLFELSKEVPLRLTLLKKAEQQYQLVWTFHHILIDGWCIDILIEELMNYLTNQIVYKELQTTGKPSLVNYHRWLSQQSTAKALEFWNDYLASYNQQDIFFSKEQVEINRKELNFVIPDVLMGNVHKKLAELRMTPASLFQALWAIVVGKYYGKKDLLMGVIVSGRSSKVIGIEKMVGLFINTLPVRVKFDKNITLFSMIKQIQEDIVKINNHDFVSVGQIQANLKCENPLISNTFTYENYANHDSYMKRLTNNELGIKIKEIQEYEQTNFPINFIANPNGATLSIKVIFDTHRVDESFISIIKEYILTLIDQFLDNHEQPVSGIEYPIMQENKEGLNDFLEDFS